VVLNDGFWSGRRVLVTGHSGFKGAWLTYMLSRLGADVTGFALPPDADPNLFGLLDIETKVKSQFGDVRDLTQFRNVARGADPEVFFHLAGQALVREGYAHPIATFETNTMGVAHALECARDLPNLRAIIIVTSDKCYRNDGRLAGYREDDALGGDDPYSCSKACAELVTESYRRSFFGNNSCAVATARAGNVIGGGDWSPDRLVPDILRSYLSGAPLKLRNPHATRPWQHVLDPLVGYLTLAEQLHTSPTRFAGAWNFGPSANGSVTVQELAHAIYDAWGKKPNWERDSGPNPEEAQCLAVDAAKARVNLGWSPQLSPADAVLWTVEWYRAWNSGESPAAATSRQIEQYQRLLGDGSTAEAHHA
jgi:CDP-glucose 4,6-dehydratase